MKYLVLIISVGAALSGCAALGQINPRETLDAFVAPLNFAKGIDNALARGDVRYFDKDGDGGLDAAEFSEAMSQSSRYRLRAADADMTLSRYIAADFNAIDRNNDGRIDMGEYEEFRDWHYNNARRRFVEGVD